MEMEAIYLNIRNYILKNKQEQRKRNQKLLLGSYTFLVVLISFVYYMLGTIDNEIFVYYCFLAILLGFIIWLLSLSDDLQVTHEEVKKESKIFLKKRMDEVHKSPNLLRKYFLEIEYLKLISEWI